MVKESHKAGDTIFLAGERGDALYVVDSGKVRIWVANQLFEPEVRPVSLRSELLAAKPRARQLGRPRNINEVKM